MLDDFRGWWEEASKEEDGDEASTVDDIKALQKGKMDCRVIETKVPVLVAQDHSLVLTFLPYHINGWHTLHQASC